MYDDAGRTPRSSAKKPRGQEPEPESDQRLTGHLGAAAQPLVVLRVDLDEVVEKPHNPAADEEQKQEPRAGARPPAGQDRGHQVRRRGTRQDHETAHGRRTPLHVVGRRAVVPDRLAETVSGEPSDGDPRAQQRADHRQPAAQQDCPHVGQPLSAIRMVDPYEARGTRLGTNCGARDRRVGRDSPAEGRPAGDLVVQITLSDGKAVTQAGISGLLPAASRPVRSHRIYPE